MLQISPRARSFLLFGAAASIFILGSVFFFKIPPQVDERIHYLEILWIRNGTSFFPREVPSLPGYHWTLAILSRILLNASGEAMRLLSSGFSFLCLAVFFILAKKIDEESAVWKTLLFLFFPILFPYFFLLYTDAYSMLLVFASLACGLNRRLWWAGFLGILSMLVRQNNLIWLGFIALIAYLEENGSFQSRPDLRVLCKKYVFFIFGGIFFLLFVIVNQGLVFGDQSRHPVSLSLENLTMCLFLFFFLFLPHNLSVIKKGWGLVLKQKISWGVFAFVFAVYVLSFRIRSIYNDPVNLGFFLHNRLLGWITSSLGIKVACFLPIAGSLLALYGTTLQRRSFYLLYPFTILFLVPLLHVEPRYYFIPFCLFLLFKERGTFRSDFATLVLYLPVIIYLMAGIRFSWFFP